MKSYVVALLVVVGILGGFYGGFKVGQNNVSANTTASGGSFNRSGAGGAFPGNRGAVAAICPSPGAATPSPGSTALLRGTITDLSSSSMTITSTACDVKVTFNATVQVSKTVTGTTGDLQDNLIVTIVGTRQADGSLLARTIQIGNGGLGGFGGGGNRTGTGGG